MSGAETSRSDRSLDGGNSSASQTVQYARQGIVGAAIMHGQLAGEVSPAGHHATGDQKLIEAVDRECYVPAPWPGHYEPLVELGATVKEGADGGAAARLPPY